MKSKKLTAPFKVTITKANAEEHRGLLTDKEYENLMKYEEGKYTVEIEETEEDWF